MHALVKRHDTPVPRDVNFVNAPEEVLEVAADLRLHVDLYDIHRIENGTGESSDERSGDEIRQERFLLP